MADVTVSTYPAPAALLAHCARAAPSRADAVRLGERDATDIAALVTWLTERDAFSSYEDWVNCGFALKLEMGDAGREIWRLTHNETVTADVEESKWASFSDEPKPGCVTVLSLLDRANKMGWRGTVRKSTSAMFDQVAAIASAVGATLPPPAGVPMLQGQQVLAEIGGPKLAHWLHVTADTPRPLAVDFPTLPPEASEHGLYSALTTCIERIVAMSESARTWSAAAVAEPLAYLRQAHAETYDRLHRFIAAAGRTWPESKIKLLSTDIESKVKRACTPNDEWHRDYRGEIERDNPDNLRVFLGVIDCEVRWNGWLDRAEIRGDQWTSWTYIDDVVHAKLSTRAAQTGTRFLPSDTFLWKTLLTLAHANVVDPALEHISACQVAWDRVPRLAGWLTATCGVPDDAYHQAVARNVIGGMVRRIRRPGCKHDTAAVFIGPQGNLKSTLAAALAMRVEWFTDTVLLDDEARELVLSLAGKCVAEISEMGSRSDDVRHAKSMLSRQTDSGRPAYGRAIVDRPRRNIFIGTTNDDKPFIDHTGNRRFLPVRVTGEINLAWLRANLDQIIGEAATLEAAGDDFSIPREAWALAAEHQEGARSQSDVEILFQDWFGSTEHTRVAYIVPADLALLAVGSRALGNNAIRGAALRTLGFRDDVKAHLHGKSTRLWVRAPMDMRPAEIMTKGVRYQIGTAPDGRPRVVPVASGPTP